MARIGMSGRGRRLVGAMAALMILGGSTVAAQDVSGDVAEIVRRADDARRGGNFGQARDLYLQAHQLQPAAIHLLKAAAASYELGEYTDTLRFVERALAEPNEPLDAQRIAFARDLEGRARALTTRLKLTIEPRDVPVTVLIDLRVAQVSEGVVVVDHGEHTITVRAPGYETFEVVMELRETDRDLVIPLTPQPGTLPSPAVAASTVPLGDAAPPPAPSEGGRSRTGLIVGVTVAVAVVLAVAIAVPLALRDDGGGQTGAEGRLDIRR
ncbi:MAG: hypothetical protein AAGH15_03800 [Myxococcota bacterium]